MIYPKSSNILLVLFSWHFDWICTNLLEIWLRDSDVHVCSSARTIPSQQGKLYCKSSFQAWSTFSLRSGLYGLSITSVALKLTRSWVTALRPGAAEASTRSLWCWKRCIFYNKQALGVEESGQRMLRAEKPSEGLDMGQTMKSNTLNNSITKERMPRPANIRAKVPYRDVFLHW
jgi:hypothetical protein